LVDNAGLARANAQHANAMAQDLELGIRNIADGDPRVILRNRADANSVFPILPQYVIDQLSQQFRFYIWNVEQRMVRWMCSWDTTPEDVAALLAALAGALAQPETTTK
jgi:threonine aldolase